MSKRWMAGCLTAFLATAGLAEMKVATVDLDKVFTAHPKTQAAEAELKKAEEAVEEEMEQVAEGLRALEADVTKLREAARSPMLSDEARATKRAEAEDKLTELQEAQLRARRTQETKLKQLREQLMASRQGIVDELLKEVAAFAEAEGFDLVLDRSGMTMNMVPLAVYSAPELDVTERLIERLKP
ncbi:MAG: OmpH family outer membrane protein [Kiritimatiellae bacterium]|nr:OmpH family outer membrane protein [Kiritimatiellia bacterium]MDD3440525.1 OmpH family outer membrane protein [Kiritimatiellia bacterium]MDD4116678.1 OmpH family outer membrane protein [Kiritimatiellia bacterium]HPC58328.1 OmpH family outer membrane protein [Kiritimatiellia bacterium]